ncbi:cytochrome-c oxidase, cbb3-type subunit III [Halomonas eurihalina]|uniref:Cbb3-type cytochrome c oxidase subunit n=1 Tax=Halomonas eurihalina TaxID=42566 RepID=A0A5D9CRY3_HALER|nr:cytochrome-c oxidase, cbb3-type subunit III [Halomonas eurihalina]MDR5860778.1 cytochrome-c oxidase, cbb3-type subunit III [Halomonas eurihalina]TZG33752.1 cytochrome-c oxidase, cbb3-type subunit III [Halomonas eurihalina]
MNSLWGNDLSGFWSAWIIIITLGTIALSAWLLFANRKTDKQPDAEGQVTTTGHAADGIEEYDNPLPRWWFKLYVGTVLFALGYLALYPGLGNFAGLLDWSQEAQWEREMHQAEARYAPIFAGYAERPIPELAGDAEAMQVAERLFLNNCAICHGNNARGGNGFPDLSDDAWLYGGSPQDIVTSITQGRSGAMPAWQHLGEETLVDVTQHVLSLSGQATAPARAEKGAEVFTAMCASCHQPDGTGNPLMGAPNLADDAWLYRGPDQSLEAAVLETLRKGRNGQMPAQVDYLGEDKVHLVAAYVYQLSRQVPESAD